jgi:O-antigen ligase
LLGVFASLIVAMPLLPSETVYLGGSAMAIILLWLLLFFVWAATGAASGKLVFYGGATLWALILFLAWHSTSALVMAGRGHPRAAINMLWQWLSFGLCFFLARQLVRTAAERRAVVALLMSVAVALSVLGYYQYFREHPLTRQQYLSDPEKVLREAQIFAPAGTPQRATFENRLFSTEPFATFALTNSLAGFLSPWMVVALGIGITNFSGGADSRKTNFVSLATAITIAGCWMLTKSRTAWLAAAFGISLLAIYGRRTGWRPDARIVAGLVTVAVLLPFVAFVIGGLDSFVLLEASKAMLYRVQYWRSTAQLISDYPLFGCGPGNFQQYYTAYKLPEASESIAEPHNFIMEIWSTAGTPALILFVAFWVCLAKQIWRGGRNAEVTEGTTVATHLGSVRALYWGGLSGCLLAMILCSSLEGYSLSAGLLAFGFPIAALMIVLWHTWVLTGRWPIAVPTIGLTVLFVNLLAAGGIGFASVASTLWVLAALLNNQVEVAPTGKIISQRLSVVIALIALIILGAFAKVGYLPQLSRETLLAGGDTRRMEGQPAAALAAFTAATEADPYSPDGWERLADLAHQAWLETGEQRYYQTFINASEEMLARNRRSSSAQFQVGRWWLAAYRRLGKPQYIEQTLAHYRIAVQRYPNYNLGRAELAWALHLSGEDEEAAREAAEALKLDQLLPHAEQKLANQRVYDSPRALPDQLPLPGERNAEQLMQELRTN